MAASSVPVLRRASVLAVALGAGLACGAVRPCLAAELAPPAGHILDFNIIRKGEVIGHYHADFTDRADHGLEVRTTVHAEISVGPITLYRFNHQSVETWKGGSLQSLTANTDDDGDVHHLLAERGDKALALTVDGKTVVANGDAVPSSLWSKAMLEGGRPIFDIGDGQQFQATAHCGADAPAPVKVVTVCEISGDLVRSLAYGADGILVELSFPAEDGSKVMYRSN